MMSGGDLDLAIDAAADDAAPEAVFIDRVRQRVDDSRIDRIDREVAEGVGLERS